MPGEMITPELVEFLRASLRMLDGELLDEPELIDLVERGHEAVAAPVRKIRELTPLEAECVLLDASCIKASVSKAAESVARSRGGGASPHDLIKFRYALALLQISGAVIGTILIEEAERLLRAGGFPDGADTTCLAVSDGALCVYAAKSRKAAGAVSGSRLRDAGVMVAAGFDLGSWQPDGNAKLH